MTNDNRVKRAPGASGDFMSSSRARCSASNPGIDIAEEVARSEDGTLWTKPPPGTDDAVAVVGLRPHQTHETRS